MGVFYLYNSDKSGIIIENIDYSKDGLNENKGGGKHENNQTKCCTFSNNNNDRNGNLDTILRSGGS